MRGLNEWMQLLLRLREGEPEVVRWCDLTMNLYFQHFVVELSEDVSDLGWVRVTEWSKGGRVYVGTQMGLQRVRTGDEVLFS